MVNPEPLFEVPAQLPETAGKTLEELGEVFDDKPVDGRAARGERDMHHVEVAEKSPRVPLEGITVLETPNVFVDPPEREHDLEDMHCREESDEEDMVDVDITWSTSWKDAESWTPISIGHSWRCRVR